MPGRWAAPEQLGRGVRMGVVETLGSIIGVSQGFEPRWVGAAAVDKRYERTLIQIPLITR